MRPNAAERERNRRIVGLLPMIRKIVQKLRISDPTLREDCEQAGIVSAMQAYDRWNDATTPWDAFVQGSLRLSITRDMIREINKTVPPGEMVTIENAELFETDLDEDNPSEQHLPVYNDGNAELDHSKLVDQMAEAVGALSDSVERTLMLLVLEGHTVSEAGRRLSLSQSAADRLYQRTVDKLKISLKSPELPGNSAA